MAKRTSVEARFFAKVRQDGDCWIWTASLNSFGYGKFWDGVRIIGSHRWSYEFLRTEIPEGLDLDHLCRTKACVNPWHLEPVTRGENTRRHFSQVTHCPQGHAYDEGNTRMEPCRSFLVRRCRTCANDRSRARYASRKHAVSQRGVVS